MKLVSKIYYSFEDAMNMLMTSPFIFKTSLNNFISALDGYIYNVSELPLTLTNTHLNSLFKLIYSRYKDEYIVCLDDFELAPEHVASWSVKLINKILLTQDRYIYLLEAYANNRDRLLSSLKATSENTVRFNDTPQNSGSYEDLEHNSTVTKTENVTTSDSTTLMNRIKEISNNYENLLLDWSNEFEECFIDNANI